MAKRKSGKRTRENEEAEKSAPIDGDETLVAEAEALVLYIARHGDMLGDDPARAADYAALQDAIALAKAGNDENFKGLLNAYSRVSAMTHAEHGINGRTVLDTLGARSVATTLGGKAPSGSRTPSLFQWAKRPRNRPALLAAALLLSIGIFEVVLLFLEGDPDHKGIHKNLLGAKELAIPFVWGAVGTCTFLMKKLSDKLSEFTFEEARARGVGTRVLLGAILGLILVELVGDVNLMAQTGDVNSAVPTGGVDPAVPTGDEDQGFPVYLIAFMGGLGIKPVYAAIEALIEGLAARIKPPAQNGKT